MRRIWTRRRGKTGFTMIELLVTIVLIGILSVATFAIILSSVNTFAKQKDLVAARDITDLICSSIKTEVSRAGKILLTDDCSRGPKRMITVDDPDNPDGTGKKDIEVDEITIYESGEQPYLKDYKLNEYNMVYSDTGRVYLVDANIDARLNYNKDTKMPISYPEIGSKKVFGNRKPLLDDKIYDKYEADVTFKPLHPADVSPYFALQVVVDVYRKPTGDEPARVFVSRGVETFDTPNVQHGQKSIFFRNDPMVEWKENDVAKDGTYKFCYFT